MTNHDLFVLLLQAEFAVNHWRRLRLKYVTPTNSRCPAAAMVPVLYLLLSTEVVTKCVWRLHSLEKTTSARTRMPLQRVQIALLSINYMCNSIMWRRAHRSLVTLLVGCDIQNNKSSSIDLLPNWYSISKAINFFYHKLFWMQLVHCGLQWNGIKFVSVDRKVWRTNIKISRKMIQQLESRFEESMKELMIERMTSLWSTHSFIHWFIHSFIHSFRSSVFWLVRSFFDSCIFIYSLNL